MLPFILLTLLSIATAIAFLAYLPYLLKKTSKETERYDSTTSKAEALRWAFSCYSTVSLICLIISLGSVVLNVSVVMKETFWAGWFFPAFIIVGGPCLHIPLMKAFQRLTKQHQVEFNTTHYLFGGTASSLIIGGALYNIIYFIHCLSLGLF
ncbi:MAG: hypothetical protein IJX87_01840 [Clostridia bacterium]|nr:hypothetical protein [Clostridia bacterium]